MLTRGSGNEIYVAMPRKLYWLVSYTVFVANTFRSDEGLMSTPRNAIFVFPTRYILNFSVFVVVEFLLKLPTLTCRAASVNVS